MQNKPNFRKSQMNVNTYNTRDYENKRNWTLGENKPNSNPIKPNLSQLKPISNPIKPNFKPKQSQFKACPERSRMGRMGQSLVNAWMFISKTAKKSLRPLPDAITMLPRKFKKPGERKVECSVRPKLRTDPKNLLGIMPAKEG